MKPIRKYHKAYIYTKNEDAPIVAFESETYINYVIYLDEHGNERTLPFYYIKEVIRYAEDRNDENSAV